MSNIQYNLQFEKLCKTMQLGDIVGEVKPLSGGLLHRMYAVETTQGKYAVKALNPQIMLRPTAMGHIVDSERIVNLVSNSISALLEIWNFKSQLEKSFIKWFFRKIRMARI